MSSSPLLLVGSEAEVLEGVFRLRRIGYDRIAGRLATDAEGWRHLGLAVRQSKLLAPKALAAAMSYDDPIRIADLKTRASRFARVRAEVGADDRQIVQVTEFMHPRMEEFLGSLPSEMADPFLIGATGRCPREDSGGAHGYQELLAALADTTHQRHSESVTWLGGDYDPAKVDDRRHTEAVSNLGRQRPNARPRERPRQSA